MATHLYYTCFGSTIKAWCNFTTPDGSSNSLGNGYFQEVSQVLPTPVRKEACPNYLKYFLPTEPSENESDSSSDEEYSDDSSSIDDD